jgi:hypothetical protein
VNARVYLAETLISLGEKEKARKHLKAISNPNLAQVAAMNKMILKLTDTQNTTP